MAPGTPCGVRDDRRCGGQRDCNQPTDEAPDATLLRYTLDASDAIVAVSGDWDRFALANGGEAILAERVIGRRLDDFIAGDVTRMFVRTMLMSVRTLGRELQRPYRCDSPRMKRLMQMTITPRANKLLDLCHRPLRQEPWPGSLPVVRPASADATRVVKRCSMCNRVRFGRQWCELDEALRAACLSPAACLNVVHGVCPDCLRDVGTSRTPQRRVRS